MRQSKPSLAVLAFTLGWAISAQANLLLPDTAVGLTGTDSSLRPELDGTIIEDELVSFTINLSGGGTITGKLQSRVSRETVAGTLDFYWRVLIDPTSAGNVGAFRLGDFVTGTYDADWRSDSIGIVGPDYAYLFSGGMGLVNFGFSSGLTPADGSSRFMFLHTDATDYDKSAFMDVAVPGYGSTSDAFPTFAPVPEATTPVFLIFALAGFVLTRRPDRIG